MAEPTSDERAQQPGDTDEPASALPASGGGTTAAPSPAALTPRMLGGEVLVVLALSLGAAAVSAVISIIGSLTAPESLAEQTASLVGSQAAAERPWLDLARQVSSLVFAMAPVALVIYLLHRTSESAATIGFDVRRPARDLFGGAALAAVIGGGGLVVYLVSYQLGLTVTVAPSALNDHWWAIPVLLLQAVKNGVLEEVIVVGYLLRRLDQLGWSPLWSAATSSLLRALYHLYQGVGMFFGNLVMGLVFCWFYRRYGRVMPLVVAHSLIDIVAFAGSVYLIGRVDWLPGGGG
ncbi:CPBP family intramembrane glutamic endopeptidase [Streptomonospora litoralis]|uniref:CAAX amino terminal protease self-immunity n=1 Tax=Streptomonospora litoralis TaxID=2498135 RepID=A0A4P6Q478_9ACTN|nr:CPBP family intramembrane glutamic endopeptidase [Streptomonospora litoralis]QBI54111.1 CAAX amino terminal protease self- immunity [Streptomonospora litoralis]